MKKDDKEEDDKENEMNSQGNKRNHEDDHKAAMPKADEIRLLNEISGYL